MAEFLNKEAVNVSAVPQSIASQANSGGNLAKDLGTLMQSFSGIAQDYHKSMITQSEQVGSALARDNLMSMIQNKQQTVQAMIDDPRGFGYEDALRQADMDMANTLADVSTKLGNDSVAKKAYDNVFLMRATELNEGFKANIYKQHKQVANETVVETALNEIDTSGNALGAEGYKSIYQSLRTAGKDDEWTSKQISSKLIGDLINANIDVKKINGGSPLSNAQKQNLWKKFADSVSTMDNNGAVKSNGLITSEDLSSIKQHFDHVTKIVEKQATYNEYFAQAQHKLDMLNSDIKNGKITAEQASGNYQEINSLFNKAVYEGNNNNSVGKVSASEFGSHNIKVTDFNEQLDIQKSVENDILILKEEDIRPILDKGKEAIVNGRSVLIEADRYKDVIKRNIENSSKAIYSLDTTTPEGLSSFNKHMYTIERMESLGGIKSSITKDMEDKLDDKSVNTIRSVGDARRLIDFAKYKQSRGNEYWNKSNGLIDRLNQQLASDELNKKDERAKITNINSIVTASKNSDFINKTRKEMDKEVKSIINDVEDGSFSVFDVMNTKTASGTEQALTDFLNTEMKDQDISLASEKLKKELVTFDYGGITPFSFDDRRVVLRTNVSARAVNSTIDTMLDEYNKKNKTRLNRSNTTPSVIYNRASHEIELSIFDGNNHVGTINKDIINKIREKENSKLDSNGATYGQ